MTTVHTHSYTRTRHRAFIQAHWPLLLVCVAASPLFFLGLDHSYFRCDEAYTAVLSRNVLSQGLPRAWDGRNLLVTDRAVNLNQNFIFIADPWLQFYLAACSFAVFGEDTLTGRLPFALFGWLCIPSLYLLARQMTGGRAVALLSALLLAFSPAFVLYARQCRYYVLPTFFGLHMMWWYFRRERHTSVSLTAFSLMAVLCFHSNYLVFGALFGGLIGAELLVTRERHRLVMAAWSLPIILILTLPWFAWVKPFSAMDGGSVPPNLTSASAACLFGRYLRDLNHFFFFPCALVGLVGVWLIGTRGRRRPYVFVAAAAVGQLLLLSLLSPHPLRPGQPAPVRYAVSLIPLFCLLTAGLCCEVWRRGRVAAIALVGTIALTNGLSFRPPLRSHLLDLVHEVTHDYYGPYEGVVDMLDRKAHEGDTVLVVPSLNRQMLQFYLGHKLRFCGVLAADDPWLAAGIRDQLPRYIYARSCVPSWIVSFGSPAYTREARRDLTERRHEYELTVLDLGWPDTVRPEMPFHHFKQVAGLPPEFRVYILRRETPRNSARKSPGELSESDNDEISPEPQQQNPAADQ